jgi:peptidoglycan hydrolase-like protein with peptidoglycan-binding domain
MNYRFVCLALLFALPTGRAEDHIRSTQEELRRRNIFFGDIDGRRSNEYSKAVERYQARKGLSATGQEDRDTLRSLGLLPRSANEPPPKELDWPEGPVLRSDARLDVAAEAEELEAETGVPAEVIAPVAAGASDRAKKRRRKVTTSSRSARAQHPQPATSTRASTSEPRFTVRNSEALPGQLTSFVSDFLRAVERNRLADELHFYGDHVDYFGTPNVDRRVIEKTLAAYYARWPKRDYTLLQPVRYQLVPSRAEIIVSYRVRFSLSNGRNKVQGETDNRLTINAATADPRIVAVEERRVRK